MNRSTAPAGSTRRWARAAALVAVPVIALTACSTDEIDGSQSLETAASADVGERAQRTATALEQAGLGTLASSVRQVNMDEVVAEGEFTLFAPDDEAFQSLTADELADLNSDTERLVTMLRGHVVQDAISADELRDMAEVTTVGGTMLEVDVEDGAVTVGDGEVLETLRLEGGGIVHVVDAMLARE